MTRRAFSTLSGLKHTFCRAHREAFFLPSARDEIILKLLLRIIFRSARSIRARDVLGYKAGLSPITLPYPSNPCVKDLSRRLRPFKFSSRQIPLCDLTK